MSFFLRNDTEKWFKDVSFPYSWDMYYLCFMAGVTAKTRVASKKEKASEIAKDFPAEYKHHSNLLISILIVTELKKLAIDYKDKAEVSKVINSIVKPDSATRLTARGLELMNEYASGGFDMLCEELPDRPRSLETFLRQYDTLLAKHRSADKKSA